MNISVPHLSTMPRRRSPRVALRGRVWLRRGTLDRRLAQGADPSSDPELAHRAAWLTSERRRRSLAAGLLNVLEAAEEPAPRLTSAVPLQRKEIRGARATLAELAHDLASEKSVHVRGVALVSGLLTDGDSPFYTPLPEGSLEAALRHARAALLLD